MRKQSARHGRIGGKRFSCVSGQLSHARGLSDFGALLVFFLLKDKQEMLRMASGILPRNRKLANKVWEEMNQQISNYIRGKVLEIVIVGTVSYITFAILDLRYSVLLAVAVGLSVLIPYIGAAAVTVPVAIVALFQWGLTRSFTPC